MLAELAGLLVRWRPAFPRHITWLRVISVLIGLIIGTGRRTITASIAARGRQFSSWAPDYLVFSRAPWEPDSLFDAVVDVSIDTCDCVCPNDLLVVAVDDTYIPKTGKSISSARWCRDPLSPPFNINLRLGLRYIHMAIIMPLHRFALNSRAISIDFTPAPSIKKPGKNASTEQLEQYKEIKKKFNLSQIASQRFKHLREHLDATGQYERRILIVGDGSYTNRTVLQNLPERVDYIGRTRKNLALFTPAPKGGRKVYGDSLPTPNELRQDPNIPWSHTELFYAGARRKVRFKEFNNVLWKRGARRRPLRLLIIAPTPYRAPSSSRRRFYYRRPAYLLTTDLDTPAENLIQAYLDRWQIEVEHRDLKSGLGVGHAQVWNDNSVARLHSAHVAMWSMVKLAALRTQGLYRTDAYPPRPAWYPQKPNDSASQRDIVELLRLELIQHQHRLISQKLDQHISNNDSSPAHLLGDSQMTMAA